MSIADTHARFIEPEPNSGCWLWIGARHRYGSVRTAPCRTERAHRLAWELEYGPIPDGLCVLHRCDTPACVNPKHLRLGTHADNMREASDRQRWSPIRPWRWGLTAAQRTEARARLLTERQKDLAAEYGVTPETIRASVGTVTSVRRSQRQEMAGTIKRRYKAGGITQQALAGEYGIDQSTVSRIINGGI